LKSNRVRTLAAELSEKTQEIVAEHEREVERLHEEQAAKLGDAKRAHAREMAELKAAMERERLEQEEELERLREAHAKERAALEEELGSVKGMIALREKLEASRSELVAREKEAVAVASARARDLLKRFREETRGAGPAVRRELYVDAMQSGYGALRVEALRAALEDSQASVRKAAMESALAAEGWALKRAALIAVLSPRKTIPLVLVERGDEGRKVNHLRVEVAESGALSGVRVYRGDREEQITSGAIRRPGLVWSDEECSGELGVASSGFLEGFMRCGRHSYAVRAALF